MKNKNHSSANCLCGGIKIIIKGKLRYVSNCHCSQCMKTHGNFAAYTSCEDKNIFFINKDTLKWFKSSINFKRGFCFKCGASIFFKKNDSTRTSISAGIFNNPIKMKTKHNIFVKGKMEYYKLDKSLPFFYKYSK